MRLLRRFADHVERHVQLDLPAPGFHVQDEFRVGVSAAEEPVSTCAARRGWQARCSHCSFTPGGLLVQLSAYRPKRRFPSCGCLRFLRLACGRLPRAACRAASCRAASVVPLLPCCRLLPCGLLPCRLLSCRLLPCRLLSCRLLPCRLLSRRLLPCRLLPGSLLSCRLLSCRPPPPPAVLPLAGQPLSRAARRPTARRAVSWRSACTAS